LVKLRLVTVGNVMLRYVTSTAPSSVLRHFLYPHKRHTFPSITVVSLHITHSPLFCPSIQWATTNSRFWPLH